MTLTIAILVAVLLAENICVIFYFYWRPDRAILRVEREKTSFLNAAALKLLNRAWGVQGAPAMDDEFEEDETPALSNRAIEDLMPEEAEAKLEEMRAELDEIEHPQKRSEGSIAKRRRLVGDMRRLEARMSTNPPRPRMSPVSDTPYINSLEPEQTAHLESLEH